MCKIQFQDESDTESDTEEFADIVPESSCSRSVPMMSSVQAAAQGKTRVGSCRSSPLSAALQI